MSLDEGFSSLIGRIYAARDDSHAWDRLGGEIMGETGSCVALMTTVDLARENFLATRFFGPDNSPFAQGLAEYPEIYSTDPTLKWASRHPTARFCASDRTVAGDYLADPFVRWNREHFGATHWYVCYSAPVDRLSHSLSIHVPAAEGTASAETLRKFRMLFEHIDNAARLRMRPPELDDAHAAVALDRTGTICACNRAGEETLAVDDGLVRREGKLGACDPVEGERLDRLIAAGLGAESSGAGASSMLVSRPSHEAPWLVSLRPTMTEYAGSATRTGVQVSWREFRAASPDGGRLQLLLGLSVRQAEVLALLIAGHSLESAACRLGISRNTVRVHLQAIFAQTRTTRQAELLQLCARLDAE